MGVHQDILLGGFSWSHIWINTFVTVERDSNSNGLGISGGCTNQSLIVNLPSVGVSSGMAPVISSGVPSAISIRDGGGSRFYLHSPSTIRAGGGGPVFGGGVAVISAVQKSGSTLIRVLFLKFRA